MTLPGEGAAEPTPLAPGLAGPALLEGRPVPGFLAGKSKKKLKRMDLTDAMKKRPVLGKTAYKARVSKILKTKKAQTMAATYANSFRKAWKEVVKKKGTTTRF